MKEPKITVSLTVTLGWLQKQVLLHRLHRLSYMDSFPLQSSSMVDDLCYSSSIWILNVSKWIMSGHCSWFLSARPHLHKSVIRVGPLHWIHAVGARGYECRLLAGAFEFHPLIQIWWLKQYGDGWMMDDGSGDIHLFLCHHCVQRIIFMKYFKLI